MAVELEWPGWPGFTSRALAEMEAYNWPGNVRELTNLVERLAVLNPGGLVRLDDLPARYRAHVPAGTTPARTTRRTER